MHRTFRLIEQLVPVTVLVRAKEFEYICVFNVFFFFFSFFYFVFHISISRLSSPRFDLSRILYSVTLMLRAAIFPGDNAVRHLGHVMLFCTICTVYVKSAAIAREEESSSTGMTNRATHQLTANEEDTKIGNDSIILENDTRDFEYAKNVTAEKKNESSVENWCVIWYLGAFGSLVSFFLIITCTELFFGNPLYRRENIEAYVQQFHTSDHIKPWKPQTPPPPYRLFAPPGYKETMKKYKKEQSSKPVSPSIYIIPVHTKTNSSSTTVEKKK